MPNIQIGGPGGSDSRSCFKRPWPNKDLGDWDVLWPPGNNIPAFSTRKNCSFGGVFDFWCSEVVVCHNGGCVFKKNS